MDAGAQRLTFLQAIALVSQVANRADQVAAGLRALREPEAADLVAGLAKDADQAAQALRARLAPTPRDTNWYQVHRDMWVRYGDPGDLAAMTENIVEPS